MTTVLYTMGAILMFGIMITVHEAGHFLAARMTGIPVREFAIGFGPKLYSWKSRKYETLFFIRLIPMGGYCAFYGEDDVQGAAAGDPRNMMNHSVWRRFLTIISGSAMNILFALVIAVLFYALSGIPEAQGDYTTHVQSVNQDSPGEAGGLLPGDQFLHANGVSITSNLSDVINAAAREQAFPMQVVVLREIEGEMKEISLSVTPLYDQHEKRYMMGITTVQSVPVVWRQGHAGEVVSAAFTMCKNASVSILNVLKNLLLRGEGMGEVSGIVGFTKMIVDEARETKLEEYLFLVSLVSINLGLFNLLPVPGLDGSRLLFLAYEGVRGKPVKKEAYVHAVGMILLFALMIWINLRDILRLFR